MQSDRRPDRPLDGGHAPGESSAWPDRATLIARFAGDEALFEEVAAIFLQDHPRLLGQLRLAREHRDLTALRAAAHAIKGAVSHFTSAKPYEAVARLERLAEAGQADAYDDVSEVERLTAEFVAVVATHASRVGTSG